MAPSDPGWLRKVGEETSAWLLRLEVSNSPGVIPWAESGNLRPPTAKTGLAAACLAARTLFMLGAWDGLSAEHRDGWRERIRRFQRPRAPVVRGAFCDGPFLCRAAVQAGFRQSRGRPWRFCRYLIDCVRGETRQALSTLIEAGGKADPPPPGPLWTPDVPAFARKLDWSVPWAAGAQWSSLVFFGAQAFAGEPGRRAAFRTAALAALEAVYQPETGAWHRGDPAPEQVMNGAMKVLTGAEWIGAPIPTPKRLIDFCLAHPPGEHGCAMTDRIYVLARCLAASGHRAEEVRREALAFIEAAKFFHHEGGGFRYFPDRSQTHYYGVRITEGRRVPDAHGTCLFVWGLALAAEILGWRKELGWRLVRP